MTGHGVHMVEKHGYSQLANLHGTHANMNPDSYELQGVRQCQNKIKKKNAQANTHQFSYIVARLDPSPAISFGDSRISFEQNPIHYVFLFSFQT